MLILRQGTLQFSKGYTITNTNKEWTQALDSKIWLHLRLQLNMKQCGLLRISVGRAPFTSCGSAGSCTSVAFYLLLLLPCMKVCPRVPVAVEAREDGTGITGRSELPHTGNQHKSGALTPPNQSFPPFHHLLKIFALIIGVWGAWGWVPVDHMVVPSPLELRRRQLWGPSPGAGTVVICKACSLTTQPPQSLPECTEV